MNVFESLIGENVEIKGHNVTVRGRLLTHSDGDKSNHKPETLTLQDEAGNKVLVRSWSVIATMAGE